MSPCKKKEETRMSTTCNVTVNAAAEARTYPYVGAIKGGPTCGNTFLFLCPGDAAGRAVAGKGWREYAEGQTQGNGKYEFSRYIPATGKVTLKVEEGKAYPRIGKLGSTVVFSTAANLWFAVEAGKLIRLNFHSDRDVNPSFKSFPTGSTVVFDCRVV